MRPVWTAATLAVLALTFAGTPTAALAAGRVAPSEQDKAYLMAAHQANLAEINSGQLARLKGTSASVRDLASKIVTDHLSLDEALIPVAIQLSVTLPAEPDDDQKASASALESMAAGADFDRQWVSTELSAHIVQINRGQSEISGGAEPAVVKLAKDAAAVLAVHHAALMRASTAASPPSHVDSGSGGFADPRRVFVPLSVIAIGLMLIMAGTALRRRSLP
jgi:putative membrane protein